MHAWVSILPAACMLCMCGRPPRRIRIIAHRAAPRTHRGA
jgi:hypothetical protein